MKKLFTIVSMTLIIPALTSCGGGPKGDMPWIVDRFDDIKVIRYEVPGFDALPLEEKELIYYLSEAAKCGRDILFDQNCPVNLPVRRTLETVYENYKGDRTTAEWKALEKYLKKVWFANGIHHHYSNDKFVPEFTEGYLLDAIETIPEEKFGSLNSLRGEVCRAIFDPALYPTKLNQKAGDDLLLTSSSNYYHNVSQAEAEAFYADMAAADAGNPEPVSYGLNSQLTKDDAGRICERVWKLGGMYSPAIERIVYWLEKAQAVAKEPQKTNIAALVSYYKTGDLKEFDRYNIGWVKDGLYDRVLDEIRAVKDACQGRLLKVIIETCLPPHGGDLRQRPVVRGSFARGRGLPQAGREGRFGQGHHRGDARRRLLPRHADRNQPSERRLDPQGARLEIGDDRQHHLRLRPPTATASTRSSCCVPTTVR